MRTDQLPEDAKESITLTNGKKLAVGDSCLAGHPTTLRYRRATITGFVRELGAQRAVVKDRKGEEWVVSRYALKIG